MRAAVSNFVGNDKLELKVVQERYLFEEVRKTDMGKKSSTLNVERGRNWDRGNSKNKCRSKSRGKNRSKFGERTLECWGCGKTSHMRKHCKASGGRDNNISDINVVDDYVDALLLSVDCSISSWILDSGTSFHTTSSRDIMVNYIGGDYGMVHLANDEPFNIVGIRDVNLKLSNGSTWKLTKVRHVPKLLKSLIYGDRLGCVRQGYEEEITEVEKDTFDTIQETETPGPKRSERTSRPIQRYSPSANFFLLTDKGDSVSYDEAVQCDDAIKWELAMKEEMESLMTNMTWELVKPLGFEVKGKENLVYKLQTSLYGLKQAPTQWNITFDNFMKRLKFERCKTDHCCYMRRFEKDYIILFLYVDDMMIVGADLQKINMLKKELSVGFAMKDLGEAKANSGDENNQRSGFSEIDTRRIPEKGDQAVQHVGCKTDKVSYASIVDSLMYAMVCTRPDIARAVGVVSRYMSTRGYVFTFGGTTISWRSKLQLIVALSSCEAEYVAMAEVVKEMIWLQTFLKELNLEHGRNTLYCDSQRAIYLTKNPVFHARTKHTGLKYHFIRSVLNNGVLKLQKILRDRNPADIFTKIVNKEKLKLCSTSVNLQSC
ncbi:hypothetical protein LIER_15276 [Lithospermum erythrorhizon]|uniref:CCHC-type domain-containing protein n=1 Tax=Lithospermum erythrorhizon TaxID=34254 RepID=A0AAV3Q291_LITER